MNKATEITELGLVFSGVGEPGKHFEMLGVAFGVDDMTYRNDLVCLLQEILYIHNALVSEALRLFHLHYDADSDRRCTHIYTTSSKRQQTISVTVLANTSLMQTHHTMSHRVPQTFLPNLA